MTNDLNASYRLFQKLKKKAEETALIINYENAISVMDLIKSRYLIKCSLVNQNQYMFEEFTKFIFDCYLSTRDSSIIRKLSKYCDHFTTCCPLNFWGRFFNLFSKYILEESPMFEVNPLRRAFQTELENRSLEFDRYHQMIKHMFAFAQGWEKNNSKLARKLYEMIAIDARNVQLENIKTDKLAELHEEINEMYLISEAKLAARKGLFGI